MADGGVRVLAPDLYRGKVALVTGGGRGIGRVIARRFAELRANVVVAGRTAETLDDARAEFEAMGARCLALPTDIRQPEQVDALLAATLERFGRGGALADNAGGPLSAQH